MPGAHKVEFLLTRRHSLEGALVTTFSFLICIFKRTEDGHSILLGPKVCFATTVSLQQPMQLSGSSELIGRSHFSITGLYGRFRVKYWHVEMLTCCGCHNTF
ncbi:UNVERIFIED_CONTAM: hypothetical protein K2H54_063220 [Gekko kuhli]